MSTNGKNETDGWRDEGAAPYASRMRHPLRSMSKAVAALALAACASLLASCRTPSVPIHAAVQTLDARADRLADANAIKRLQRAYGYYWDKGQWDDVADLFTADAVVEYGNEGVQTGAANIRKYFRSLGHDR